jgi:hypothetical protein
MMHKLISTGCMLAIAAMGAAVPAYADANHGASCEDSSRSPGNAATSPGSFFNEPGINSVNGGKGNQAANLNTRQNNPNKPAGESPSQYDIACANVSANGTGTPVQTTAPTGDITNNNVRDRAVSHTGNGPK